MMRRIVASSLRYRRLLLALAGGLLVFGISQLPHVTVDQLPEFGPTMVEVRTEALGLSAIEVEQLITTPLEQDLLNGIAFLEEIHSESLPGLSSVVMLFEPGTPLLDARQVVAEKVAEAAVALPGVSSPPQMLQPLSSTGRVMAVRLWSEELTPIRISELARWTIMPRLLGVRGVAHVSIWGFRDRQLQVLVDPERLRAEGLTLQQIVETTGNSLWFSPLTFLEASTPGTAGFIDTPNQRIGIRHELPIRTADDLAQIPIEGDSGAAVIVDGKPLRLGDVTEVVEDHQPLIGDALFRDGPGLLLVIEKFPDANTIEVTRGIDEAFDAMRPGLRGLRIDTSLYRPASYIESSTAHLATTLGIGGFLALLVLIVLLRRWRAILVCAVVIAVSLVAAGTVLFLRDAPVNAMVLAGLVVSLAIVVDDAIGDVHHLAERFRRRSHDETGTPPWRLVLDASLEMRGSLLYATLIVVASVIPGFFLAGTAGSFLPSVVLSYLLAVGVSMVVALILTPGLGLMLLAKLNTPPPVSPPVRSLRRDHEAILTRVIRRPRWGYGAIGVAMVIGITILPFLDRSSLPTFKENDLVIHWDAAPGTSLPAMNELTRSVVDDLDSVPGIRNVSAHVGRAIHSDQVVGINSGQIWVHLAPSADHERAVEEIDRILSGYPDLSHRVSTYSRDRIAAALQGTDQDVVVRVYGTDREILETKAEEIRSLLSEVEGIREPTVERAPTEPTIEVEVNLEEAQRFAVKPGDVRRAAAVLLSGLAVGNLFEEQKVFDVVVWGTPEIREDPDDVRRLLIDTPSGGHVRLGRVADVRVVPNPTVIRHDAVSNYLDVSGAVVGRDGDAVAADVRRAVDQVRFPLGHHAVVRGALGSQDASRSRLIAIAVAAAIAIFLLLQAAFSSWRLAALAYVTLPIALVGGLIATAVTGGTIGIGVLAGMLASLGIAARTAVLMIRHYRGLELRDEEAFGDELVVRGTRERSTPTLVAALATIAALTPIVVAGDIAGLEVVRPMVIALIGGLVTSTAMSLLVLPALYRLHGFGTARDAATDELIVLPESPSAEVQPIQGEMT